MSGQRVSIIALILLFVVGTLLPINMGALAFVAAWLVGMYSLGLPEKQIIGGMSADLVLTLVGVTYLFAIARNNGTVNLIVRASVAAVRGKVSAIPWVMFAVTGVLTAIGAASPAACAIIGPIALGFAGRYGINPLLMGMFVVHGAQAGGFSPISIYGSITNNVMVKSGLPSKPVAVFLVSLSSTWPSRSCCSWPWAAGGTWRPRTVPAAPAWSSRRPRLASPARRPSPWSPVSAVGIAASLSVASTIVDVSPYSTNGALMVANRPDTITEERFYRQVLGYAAIVTLVGPLLVWALVVLPGWI